MRAPLALLALAFASPAWAQDQAELQKQLQELLTAYPQGFASLVATPGPAAPIRTHLSGTVGDARIMSDGEKRYVSAALPTPKSAADAKASFDLWVGVLDKIELGGAKLVGAECEPDEFNAHCRVWTVPTSTPASPSLAPFRIYLSTVNIMGSFGASILIGGV